MAAPTTSKYHRPGYLRALEAYEGVKSVYNYGRGFVVVRSVAPLVERVAEITLSRLPVVGAFKQPAVPVAVEGDYAANTAVVAVGAPKINIAYPTLQGIDAKVAALLAGLDDYLDASLGDPKTFNGKVLRTATYVMYKASDWTPFVGRHVKQFVIEIDPERSPRLLDRPPLELTTGESAEEAELIRGSFDKDVDDVSVVTDVSEDVTGANGKNGDGKKKKDKRFLRNMGKGIKKVMNYPRTPVHDVVPSPSGTTGNGSIGAEEEGSVVSGAPTPSNSGSGSGGGGASVTSTDAVASSTGSSSTASTPLRTSSARKFFAAATAPGKAKAAAAAAAEGERSSA